MVATGFAWRCLRPPPETDTQTEGPCGDVVPLAGGAAYRLAVVCWGRLAGKREP